MNKNLFAFMFLLITVLVGCSQSQQENSNEQESEKSVNGDLSPLSGSLEHVHGLGYMSDGTIAIASHSGIKLYQNGEWLESNTHKNDYMGFNMVDEGFYTSGHPGPTSDLQNPIGLQKGKLSDKDLTALAFKGESDFHAMGVGYRNHAVYVLNERPNSQMGQGLYRSFDNGETWEQLEAENLGEKIFQIAVHPDDEKMVAVASASGIYFSQDGGDSFERVSEQGQGSGLYFSENQLYYGLYTERPSLISYEWTDQSKEEISLPDFQEDAVMYLSQNPENNKELVIFTIQGSSYTTDDSGDSWTQIINNGDTK